MADSKVATDSALPPQQLIALARAALDDANAPLAADYANSLIRFYPDEFRGPLLRAQALAACAQVDEALASLDQALGQFPSTPKLLALSRNLARQQRDIRRASEYSRKLKALDPLDAKNRIFLVQFAIDQGDLLGALHELQELESSPSNDPRTTALLATVQYDLGQVDQARQTIRAVLDSPAANPEVLSRLLPLALKIGELASPVEIAQKLLVARPDHVPALTVMLASARSQHDAHAALRWSTALVAAQPSSPEWFGAQAHALLAMDRPDEALEAVRRGLENHGSDVKLLVAARDAARKANRPAEAESASEYGRRLKLLKPLDAKNRFLLVQFAIDRGDFVGALDELRELESLIPNEPRTTALLARVQHGLGQTDQARQTVRAALDDQAVNPGVLDQLLRLAREVEVLGPSVEIAERILVTRPEHVAALRVMLASARSRRDPAAIARWSSALVTFDPSRPEWVRDHARALLAMDRHDEALDALRAGLDVHGSSAMLLADARDVAFKADRPEEAHAHAKKLANLAPNDPQNNAFLAWIFLRDCDFDAALKQSSGIIERSPDYASAWRLRAKALASLFRVDEAMATFDQALEVHANDPAMTSAQLDLVFRHGHFEKALALARNIINDRPGHVGTHVTLVASHMGLGNPAAAQAHLAAPETPGTAAQLRKLSHYCDLLEELRAETPALLDAWLTSVRNRTHAPLAQSKPSAPTVMIQYWSQGTPPRDVTFVVDQWRRLLAEEELGELQLFDKMSGRAWIEEFAPSFLEPFDKSFHFAMESDVFRIAFASRRPCTYMDIDSWPLARTADVLRYGISQEGSLLYFRSSRPWLVNGFFISKPSCPFIQELAEQTLALDLDAMPKNHTTIETSFGPTRFNVVAKSLIARSSLCQVDPAGAFGCSRLTLDGGTLLFAHEAAVAAVQPPFVLGYKRTRDHWKRYFDR